MDADKDMWVFPFKVVPIPMLYWTDWTGSRCVSAC